jgi:CheY-like chemotaxis protein
MKRRLLVVDDSPVVRGLVSQLMENDFDIDEATDGRAALALLHKRLAGDGPMPAVIVSDLDMVPGMCGDVFAREIAKEPLLAVIPFLLSSADPNVGKVAEAIGVPAFDKRGSLAFEKRGSLGGIREVILKLAAPPTPTEVSARIAELEAKALHLISQLQAGMAQLTEELAEAKRVEDKACHGLEERCMLVVTAVEKASHRAPLTFHDAVAEIARLGRDREATERMRAQRDEQAKALGVIDGLLRAIVVYAKKPSEAHASAVEARGIIAALAALHPDLVADPTATPKTTEARSGAGSD